MTPGCHIITFTNGILIVVSSETSYCPKYGNRIYIKFLNSFLQKLSDTSHPEVILMDETAAEQV